MRERAGMSHILQRPHDMSSSLLTCIKASAGALVSDHRCCGKNSRVDSENIDAAVAEVHTANRPDTCSPARSGTNTGALVGDQCDVGASRSGHDQGSPCATDTQQEARCVGGLEQSSERQLRFGNAPQDLCSPGAAMRADRIPNESAPSGETFGSLRLDQLPSTRWKLETLLSPRPD